MYTSLSVEEASLILGLFGAGPCLSVGALKGGLANSVFRADCAGDVSLCIKICNEKPLELAELQGRFSQSLASRGFLTPRVHRTLADGAYACHVPGAGSQVVAQVFDFVDGECPTWLPTAELAGSIGAFLGRMHALTVSAEFEAQIAMARPPAFAMGVSEMAPFLAGKPELKAENAFCAELDALLPVFEGLEKDQGLPRGWLHGDLFAANTLVKGGRLAAVIDFEELCYGPLVLDVAMTVIGCFFDAQDRLHGELVEAFLVAYEAQRAMTREERQAWKTALKYAALSIAFWRYRQFNHIHPGHNLKDHYLQMVKRAKEAE
jgi:homoserine kinase type II